MRAFLAVKIPEEVQGTLAELQRQLAESRADVTWVADRNLHVTLKFLGEITDARRAKVEAMLHQVAQGEAPFSLGVDGGVGAFPSLTAPRVVWVGLATGKEAVTRIGAAIEQEGQAIGLQKEERPFAAHVTLGRMRGARHRQALITRLREAAWQAPAAWQVTSLTLYQSVLESDGPTYTVLADAPLRETA